MHIHYSFCYNSSSIAIWNCNASNWNWNWIGCRLHLHWGTQIKQNFFMIWLNYGNSMVIYCIIIKLRWGRKKKHVTFLRVCVLYLIAIDYSVFGIQCLVYILDDRFDEFNSNWFEKCTVRANWTFILTLLYRVYYVNWMHLSIKYFFRSLKRNET